MSAPAATAAIVFDACATLPDLHAAIAHGVADAALATRAELPGRRA